MCFDLWPAVLAVPIIGIIGIGCIILYQPIPFPNTSMHDTAVLKVQNCNVSRYIYGSTSLSCTLNVQDSTSLYSTTTQLRSKHTNLQTFELRPSAFIKRNLSIFAQNHCSFSNSNRIVKIKVFVPSPTELLQPEAGQARLASGMAALEHRPTPSLADPRFDT